VYALSRGRSDGAGKHRPRSKQQRARYRRRRIGAAAVVLVLLLLIAAGRLATEGTPPLTTTRVLAAAVSFPGPAPAPDWPAQGQAAVAVPGVGALQHNAGTPEPIASVAKVMTAYVVLRDYPLAVGATGFDVTVSDADVDDLYARQADNQSTVPVVEGEVLNEYQLLEGLLIPSGNNFAPILADYDAGGVAPFVTKMNATAKHLGMDQTTYTDPSGFDPTTVSTAADQVVLGTAAMAFPAFADIVDQRSATLPVAGVITNFDTLLGTDGFVGLKTGSDSTSGGCFVFADRRMVAGRPVTVFGAVLGQDVGTRSTSALLKAVLGASQRLADSVAGALTASTFVPAGTAVMTVENAQGHRISIVTTSPLARLSWGDVTIPLRVSVVAGRRLEKGQQVATVTALASPPLQSPATAVGSMPGLTFGWKLDHIL